MPDPGSTGLKRCRINGADKEKAPCQRTLECAVPPSFPALSAGRLSVTLNCGSMTSSAASSRSEPARLAPAACSLHLSGSVTIPFQCFFNISDNRQEINPVFSDCGSVDCVQLPVRWFPSMPVRFFCIQSQWTADIPVKSMNRTSVPYFPVHRMAVS